jgi:glucokinase
MILVGDIGGTRTRLAAFQTEGSQLNCVVEKTYASQEHGGLQEVLVQFIRTEQIPVHSACFGVAGPVRGGKSKISNLPWTIDSRELASQLKLPSVGLLNDMEAYAYGIDALDSKDFVTLSEGSEDAEGNRAVISARTGLGMAGLYWDGFRHHPFACEGGHADFAPKDSLQVELLSYLQKKYGRISCERVLSGPGIKNIYDFLRDTD